MRSVVVIVSMLCALALAGPALAAPSPSVAALQVALNAQGYYVAPIDGLDGPLTRAALQQMRSRSGVTGETQLGHRTRAALGALGNPLLGQRELLPGAVGWDVASLEFQLRSFGLPPGKVDGRFDAATSRALARFQSSRGLTADGIAGPRTYRALGRGTTKPAAAPSTPATRFHVVLSGESFYSVGQRYRVSPLQLASANRLHLSAIIVPGQRLRLPAGAASVDVSKDSFRAGPSDAGLPRASAALVQASLDRWSAEYGVDPGLARAVAWMESGFQPHVVSSVGAIGVMQLLPGTWRWLDTLIGVATPRNYDGNVRAGVRYLRWLLDEFDGKVRLALAGYYQGARAVREKGLFADTKQYVTVVLRLYGSV
jgi:soluble lytic murein transglycosylase-like protein